jgi:hypothetical protein
MQENRTKQRKNVLVETKGKKGMPVKKTFNIRDTKACLIDLI